MPSTTPSSPAGPARARRAWAGPAALRAQIGVDEHDVVSAPLGRRPFQAAQGRRAAARRRDVDVRLGRQGRGQRLGEDAVVVDDQNADAHH